MQFVNQSAYLRSPKLPWILTCPTPLTPSNSLSTVKSQLPYMAWNTSISNSSHPLKLSSTCFFVYLGSVSNRTNCGNGWASVYGVCMYEIHTWMHVRICTNYSRYLGMYVGDLYIQTYNLLAAVDVTSRGDCRPGRCILSKLCHLLCTSSYRLVTHLSLSFKADTSCLIRPRVIN